MPRVEVEKRAFLSDEKYRDIESVLREKAEHVNTVDQETHYLDTDADLRIQRSGAETRVWLKKGEIHDTAREEIELTLPPDMFETVKALFAALGYETGVVWLRTRKKFRWDGVTVCLDTTTGYGNVLELEVMCAPGDEQEAEQELDAKLEILGVEETPGHVFDNRYEEYIESWRERLADKDWTQ